MDYIAREILMPNALSDKKIMELVEGKARLVTHNQIGQFRNIDDLLGPHGACIILYVTKVRPDNSIYGHWCCVFRAPWKANTISYFDPYGNLPDATLQYVEKSAMREFGDKPVLSQMLYESGYHVVYNIAPLQESKPGDAICGRLTGLRLQFRNLDGEQFAMLLNSYKKKGMSSDTLATLLTSFIN